MDRDIESEIRQQFLNNNRFYQPLSRLLPIEFNINGYTTYSFNGDEDFVQLLFPPPNDPVNDQPSTSAAAGSSDNFLRPRQPPRNRRRFEETITQISVDNRMERICQLCEGAYRNRRHQNQFRKNNICCVCRVKFPDVESLIEHVEQTIKSNLCCVAVCQMLLTDREQKKIHLNRKH